MRCYSQIAALIFLTVLTLSIQPALAFSPYQYFFGGTSRRSPKKNPNIVIAKAVGGVTPKPEDWNSDADPPILIPSPVATEKIQDETQRQAGMFIGGGLIGRPELTRRKRLKFRGNDKRSKRLKRISLARAAARAKLKTALEENVEDEKVRYGTNTANILLLLSRGDGTEENAPHRSAQVVGRDEPLIVIDIDELTKNVNKPNGPQPIYDSDVQYTADDTIEDQSYYWSEEYDEPSNQRERFRHNLQGRAKQYRRYSGKIRRKRPNKSLRRNSMEYYLTDINSRHDAHDDHYDTSYITEDPNYSFPIHEESEIYEKSSSQVHHNSGLSTPRFNVQDGWIVVLESGKYRINKDSITKLDDFRHDRSKRFQDFNPQSGTISNKRQRKQPFHERKSPESRAYMKKPEEISRRDVDYHNDNKYHNKRSTSNNKEKEKEHDDFSYEDDEAGKDVILEYDTRGFKDVNGVTLVIARGVEDEQKGSTSRYKQRGSNEKGDSKRRPTTNSQELNMNEDKLGFDNSYRSRKSPEDLVERAAEHRPARRHKWNSRRIKRKERVDHRQRPQSSTITTEGRLRTSKISRSNQDALQQAVDQAKHTPRKVTSFHRSNKPLTERFSSTRYPTQDIERMSQVSLSSTDDLDISTIVAGEQNFHSLEEWTGSVSPTDKSLFESRSKVESNPTRSFSPQTSNFSQGQHPSRWATLNQSSRHSADFSPRSRPAASYPRALRPRPTHNREI